MVQVLPQQPSLTEMLGAGLGQGVQTGTQGLMESLIKEQMQQRQFSKLSEALFGSPQQTTQQPSTGSQLESDVREAQKPQVSPLEQAQDKVEQIATNPVAMMQLESINPQMANMVQKMYDTQLKEKELQQKHGYEQQKLASSESKDYKKRIEELESSLPDKRMGLYRIEDAMKSGDLKSLGNLWADIMEAKGLPGDYFRSNSAAALQSATKEFFLADLSKIKGGRPNQFIEKQLSSAYPKALYDPLANKKILKAMKIGTEITEKEVELYNKISDEMEAKGKFVPGNVSKLVNRELKKFVNQKEDELTEYYQSLEKTSKSNKKTEFFDLNGHQYNIPKHLVPAFKKEMGIK